jgi:hypothetical protein
LSRRWNNFTSSSKIPSKRNLSCDDQPVSDLGGEFGYPFHQVIRNHSITIFRGYQAQIVSVNLRKLIEKHFEDSSVINYLQYAIRLLHFIRAQAEHPPKEKYSTLQFKGVEELDPFEETCKALNFLKEGLDPGRYDSLIEALREEISLEKCGTYWLRGSFLGV